eukprot:augustus_masked-scaffold_1-processed-gene-16.11-mRNA-1 protein AED:1.00 eAED:1.00 QI:0/0/0/0/1/1/4/0/459
MMDRSQTEISQLKDFSEKEMKRFIHEYERLDKPQHGLVKLTQRLNQKTCYHLESCCKLTSNETIIEFLKSLLYNGMVERCNAAADLIGKNVKFHVTVKEQQVVEVMFREVRDFLSRLPDGMERKLKQIAKAILNLLPDYIRVRGKDLFIRPELKADNRDGLKKYILNSIPPRHIRCHKKDKPRFRRPSDDVLNQQWEIYMHRKREERDRKQLKLLGNVGKKMEVDEEDFFTAIKRVESEQDNDEGEGRVIFLSTVRPYVWEDFVDFSQIAGDVEVQVVINDERKNSFVALLDGGANAMKKEENKQSKMTSISEEDGCKRLSNWFENIVGASKLLMKSVNKVAVNSALIQLDQRGIISLNKISKFENTEIREEEDTNLSIFELRKDEKENDIDLYEDDELIYEPFTPFRSFDKFVRGANPGVFKEDGLEDEVNLDKIDEGVNLDASKEKDMENMKGEIEK